MATERPRYEVLQQRGDLEVREYAPYLVAETEVGGDLEAAGTTAFRVLAGYIFGEKSRFAAARDDRARDPAQE